MLASEPMKKATQKLAAPVLSRFSGILALSGGMAILAAIPVLAAAPAPAPPPPARSAAAAKPQPVLKDRVVGVVDEDPILGSDLDRAMALGFAERKPGEGEVAFRRRALDLLIDDRLRFHKVDRFGFDQVPTAAIDEQVGKIRARFSSPAELDRVLRAHGLTVEGVRQIVARQLLVYTFVEERLGSKVFVDSEGIGSYYRQMLVPEMRRQGKNPPPLDDVREDIRKVLQQQNLNQELERWTKELRSEADIAIYLDTPAGKLPPVVQRIDKKPPH
jgi:hypothetical protein